MGQLLDVREVVKSFGATRALGGVDLRLDRGEVVSILGENGAGKSTLIKILSGVLTPDAGTLAIDDQPVRFARPRDSLAAGIAYIPQELSAVGPLSVAENLVLGEWPGRVGFTSGRTVRRRASEICERTGISLPLDRTAASLRLGDLQALEIAKALARSAKIILLDEPTAALSEAEAGHLFGLVRRLTARGVGVIFVSHRLDEVTAISDRVMVLRNGTCVADLPRAAATRARLTAYMVGEAAGATGTVERAAPGEPLLEVAGLRTAGRPPLRDINLVVRSGEVVGLYGIRGSGASVIAEVLGGAVRAESGTVQVDGRRTTLPRDPRAAAALGIAYIPPDRKRNGLLPSLSIAANLAAGRLGRGGARGFIRLGRERAAAGRTLADLRVKVGSDRQSVMTLSGGNQQKILVAGRIAAVGKVLVAHEPTRGVDIGARVTIHQMIRDLALTGRGALVVTSDVEEIVAVSDRVLVIRDGELVAELHGAELTEAGTIAAAAQGRAEPSDAGDVPPGKEHDMHTPPTPSPPTARWTT